MDHQISEEFREYCFLHCEIPELYHEAAMRAGLSDSVMNILYTISVFGDDCTQSSISRLTGIPRQTINSAIRKLEREGILYLEEITRKTKIIRLTAQGQALTDEKVLPIIRAEQAVFEAWTPEERRTLLSLTRKYFHDFQRNLCPEE
ncbi:MAG: winged helix-turn-helix transcriptional regulator [Oscillospiraceae bacterium]|nr:winged helix-turn-helix transcriptional regulator [Oscillospiraceae bacterium]